MRLYISGAVGLYNKKKGGVKVKIQTVNLRHLKKGFLDQREENGREV